MGQFGTKLGQIGTKLGPIGAKLDQHALGTRREADLREGLQNLMVFARRDGGCPFGGLAGGLAREHFCAGEGVY